MMRLRSVLILAGLVCIVAMTTTADLLLPEVYLLTLQYDKGAITGSVELGHGGLEDMKSQPEAGYRADVVGADDRRFPVTFEFPRVVFIEPSPGCVENGTFIRERCPSEEHLLFLDEADTVLRIPYNPLGVAIEVFDPQNKRVLSLDISKFSDYCGDNRCSAIEDPITCNKDCRSGQADLVCDGLADGICDPDCMPQEDRDCKQLVRVGRWIVIGAFLIVVLGIVLFLLRRRHQARTRWPP